MTATVQKTGASKAPRAKKIRVSDLTVYPEVQRQPPSRASVMQIVTSFAWDKLGALHISERSDGTLSVVDGQRRVAALKQLGHEGRQVLCLLYQGLTIEQEANLFRDLNNQRVVGSLDHFMVGLTAKDPTCVGIRDMCKDHGVTVGRTSSAQPGCTNAIRALYKVWGLGADGSHLGTTLRVIKSAFGEEPNAYSGHLIEGVGRIVAASGVNTDVLADKMQRKFPSPNSVVSMGRELRNIEGGSLAKNIESVIRKVYKKPRKRA